MKLNYKKKIINGITQFKIINHLGELDILQDHCSFITSGILLWYKIQNDIIYLNEEGLLVFEKNKLVIN